MSECDIIHLHTFNLLVAMAAAASGKKIIYTIHGNFNFGRKVRLSDHVSKFLKKVFLRKYPVFISYNSEFTKKTAIARFGTGRVYSKVIHNGIFQDHPSPVSDAVHLGKMKNKFIVGTSSRFAGFKRIDRLIDGFALFASDKENVLLLLVGDGILREELIKQVELKGISSKTLFTGYQANVVNYQAAMDFCVFPSENEPFGLVAVETLRLCKPTIVFNDGGGMCEIIMEAFPEEVVSDVKALSKRLDFHYANNDHDEKIIQRRKNFAESFDALKMEKVFYQEYLHVLNK
jgi:glycosyltransferase involved in cell wall biosynthesis